MFMRRFVSAAAVALAAIAALAAQQAPPTPPTPPDQPAVTFKVAINYVEVDASVFDRDGQFVPNLKKEDFEVLEDGVRQDVTAFTQVNIPIERPEPPPLQAKTVIEPDVVSNVRPFEGRVYVIILDDKHTAALRSQLVKRAATQFISQYMAANDMAAVITTGGQLQATQEFTSNKRLLLRAVNNFMGQKIRSETEERLTGPRLSSVPWGRADPSPVDDPRDLERGYDRTWRSDDREDLRMGGQHPRRRKAIVWFRGRRLRHLQLPEAQGKRYREDEGRLAAARGRTWPSMPSIHAASARRSKTSRPFNPFPTTRRLVSASARCRTSCACRRTACARCRRRPAASPSSTRTTSPPPSSASSRTTARTTSWRITRRTRGLDGPTRSTCA